MTRKSFWMKWLISPLWKIALGLILFLFVFKYDFFWSDDLNFEDYQGMFFSLVIPALYPNYAKAMTWTMMAIFPLSLLGITTYAQSKYILKRSKDYDGNYVGDKEMKVIHKNFEKYEKRRQWNIHMTDRNKIWLGVSLLTGEDIYIDGEDLFTGTLILGSAGTGKTSRYQQVIQKQLIVGDTQGKTSFIYFVLKAEDAKKFGSWLHENGKKTLFWSQSNILDLALDSSGGIEEGKFTSLVQGGMKALGLGDSQDQFWINESVYNLCQYAKSLRTETGYASFGQSFDAYRLEKLSKAGKGQQGPSPMEMGLVATLNAVFGDLASTTSRAHYLYSPSTDGGLHVGSMILRAGGQALDLVTNQYIQSQDVQVLPPSLYEIESHNRIPMRWDLLTEGINVILPPPGSGSLAEKFAMNFIKQSFFAYVAEDASSAGQSKLLHTLPEDRHRIVLSQDEGHNFLVLEGNYNDIKSLQEHRQSGVVQIFATQSFSALKKSKNKDVNENFLANIGTQIFLGVHGEERKKVLDSIGKVKKKQLERSYNRSELGTGDARTFVDANGNLITPAGANARISVNEQIKELETYYMSLENYSQLPRGAAICTRQGKNIDVIYCPYHTRVKVTV